ncbi:MAG: hypothetical protein WBE34_15965 [Candidatus Nitrosopolaris sp.]
MQKQLSFVITVAILLAAVVTVTLYAVNVANAQGNATSGAGANMTKNATSAAGANMTKK